MYMKIKEWARKQGICYHTALRWFHAGRLPVAAMQTETGTILTEEPTEKETSCKTFTLYARVSSNDQKNDLARQLDRLRNYAAAKGYDVVKEVSEIGSGLNGKRRKLLSILSSDSSIIVEHSDRLCRFGFEYLKTALKTQGRSIIVINNTDHENEFVQDFIDVVTSMCAKIYGRRSAKNKAKRALEAVENEN